MSGAGLVASRYLAATFEDMHQLFAAGQGREGQPGAPARFPGCSGGQRLPLGRYAGGPPPAGPVGAGGVSRLLGLAYGLTHLELGPSSRWPYHRATASARCLYPTELFLWLDDLPGLPTGLHFFDSAHHGLVRLRDATVRDQVADLLCLPVAPRWVVFVTSLFAKTAYRYREYAYRLCCQEGGMVTGALLAAAAEAGRAARAYTEFLDGPAAALLGTDPGAGALLAAVAIDPGRPGGTGGTTGAQGPAGRLDTSGHAGGADWARVGELDRAGWHEGPGAVHAARNAVPARPGRVRRTSLGDVLAADRLATALLSRESGAPDFLASPRPLPAAVLAGVVRALDGTWPGDRLTADRLLSGRIVLQRSGELPPGTYVAAGERLVPVRTGPLGVAYQAAVRSMNINPCAVAAGVYVCADCEAYLCAHGDRGYRLMHLDAGVLAEWVRLAAAAHGLVARVSNGYDTARMRALLGLTDVSSRPLFQVFLGAGAYGARYRFPLSG